MRPTFFGFEIARSGMYVAQKSLDITGQNIANVDTIGYTRQRLLQTSLEPYGEYLQFKPLEQGRVGQGVRGQYVQQIRDVYLDMHYRNEMSVYRTWDARATILGYVEDVCVGMLEEHGLNGQIQSFFNSFSETANANATFDAIRNTILVKAQTLIAGFKTMYNNLVMRHDEQNSAISGDVDQINSYADQIAVLNKKIYDIEQCGVHTPVHEMANELRDKRNLLMDQMSELADFTYSYDAAGRLTISMAGGTLVSHDQVDNLVAIADRPSAIAEFSTDPSKNVYNIYFASDTTTAVTDLIQNGTLFARIEMRDGDNISRQGIPYFIAQLNELAGSIVNEVNAQHSQGWTYPYTDSSGTSWPSITGVDFFLAFTSIGEMDLSDDVKTSLNNIACAGSEIGWDLINAGDKLNLDKISALYDSTTLAGIGSFQDYLEKFASNLGAQSKKAADMAKTEATVMIGIETNRLSVMSVSMDEEVTNLVKFGHSYAASSRFLTTLDEILDRIINQTGIVGR